MGCSCGKGKRKLNSVRRVTTGQRNEGQRILRSPASSTSPGIVSQQTQNQTQNQFSALAKNNQPSQRILNTETEKKRRIQISLRNRNTKRS